ncbi:hypothetical protein CK203_092709 [Vitis vinifera]|uniref:Uncharacterized protein n=1 Tax=Vitis vinifera TaxID=29760 RepID=A0A438D859_VITVI|nr:hypothetical protein CK203_092709 [Vitis vinifera]
MDDRKNRRTENGRADALAGIAASLPIKEAILLPIHVQANPSVRKLPLAIPLRQAKQRQEWTNDIIGTSGQALCPRIPSRHKRSGCNRQFHLDWGAFVQAVLHRSLSPVPKPFRGPGPFARKLLAHDEEGCGSLRQKMRQMSKTCPHTTYVVGDAETNFRPLTLRTVGYGHSRTPTSCTHPKEIPARRHDYFSKWVEVEAYASIKDKDVTKATTIRTEAGRQDDANAELGRNLDWADEVRETASIRMADYQQRASAHYNRKGKAQKLQKWHAGP